MEEEEELMSETAIVEMSELIKLYLFDKIILNMKFKCLFEVITVHILTIIQ